MANNTNIRLRRSSVPGKIPTVSDLQLGELGLNTYDGKIFFKKNVSGTETILEINPSDPQGGNRVFVSAKNGNDSGDGINTPVKTIKKACQIAAGMPKPVTIMIASGEYYEDNPIIVSDDVSVIGDGLRSVIIRPLNNKKDVFRVRNKSYLSGFTFRDALDNNGAPSYTFDYAIAFDDPLDTTTSRVGYTNLPSTKPLITTSPYIQNCSLISFLGANGVLIDGDKVVTPNTPTIQAESETPVAGAAPEQGKSMVANAFTILSFGGTAWRLINDAYAQLVSCFEIFCANAVYTQSGGYASITNSATNFGRYGLRSVGYSANSFVFDRGFISQAGLVNSKQAITIIGTGRETTNHFIAKFFNGSTDVTSTYKTPSTVVSFNAATAPNTSTNIFTINSHGFLNGHVVLYSDEGNTTIGGLDDQTIYYVKQIDENTFYLCHDDSLLNIVDITSVGSGTQKLTRNEEEFFIDGIVYSHNKYQNITIPAGTVKNFTVTSTVTGVNGVFTCSGTVYSYTPNTVSTPGTLVVSVDFVSQSGNLVQNLFVPGMTIQDHSGTPQTVTLGACSTRDDLYTTQANISSTVTGQIVQSFSSLIGKGIRLHRPSIVNASSHTFEFVGSGTDYNALPQNGGQTEKRYEQVQDLPGRVYCSATNELGDFVVGPYDPATGRNLITAENRTGNIYFTQKVTVGELSSIKLSLSNVSIDSFSTDIGLGDNEIGGASNSRISTQLAVRSFLNNRLGYFIDKTSSTNSVPGAIVQLNSAGKINSDLIPQTRTFNNFTVSKPNRRLEIFETVPATEVLAGDFVTESYTEGAINTFTFTGTGTGTNTYTSVSATGGSGNGATFNVTVTSGVYSVALSSFGTGYTVGNTLTIPGTSLGGTSTANDITITVTALTTVSNAYVLQSDTISQYIVIDPNQTPDFTGITQVHGVISDADGSIDVTKGTNGYKSGVISSGTLSNQGDGYNPTSGTKIYYDVPLTGGSGSGATADITVTAGKVVSILIIKSGSGYTASDSLSANYVDLGGVSPTTAFAYTVNAVEKRLYVNLINQKKKFIASSSVSDFISDANASSKTLTNETLIEYSFDSSTIDIVNDRVTLTTNGALSNGDILQYDSGAASAIGGILSAESYYVKVISTSGNDQTVEFYTDYGLGVAAKINLTSTGTGTHYFYLRSVNVEKNTIRIAAHGFSTGDAVLYTSTDAIGGISSGTYYFVGSVTTNNFTLHASKSSALESVNGLTTTPINIVLLNGTGTISTSTTSTTVTGSGTNFDPELGSNDLIYNGTLVNSSYEFIGKISSVTNDTTAVLAANAKKSINGSFGYVPAGTGTFKKSNIRLVGAVNTSAQVYGAVDTFTTSGGGTIVGQANQTYTNVASTTSGAGTNATFTITRDSSGVISSVVVYKYGSNYSAGDILIIAGNLIGGTTPTDDLTVTLTAVLNNWSALSGANIDSSNIISGTIVPSRLGSGSATTTTFLRGDSSWQYAVQGISVDSTSPLSISVTAGLPGGFATLNSTNYYYGDIKLSVNRVDGGLNGDLSNYTNLGVASFHKAFFSVTSAAVDGVAGAVTIKPKTIDALLLNGQPDTYYLNPNNLSTVVPVSKGGTGNTTVPQNGQLLIGNGVTYDISTLTAGASGGLSIVNGAGTITIDTAQDIRTTATPTFNQVIVESTVIGNTLIETKTITQSQPAKYIADSFNSSAYSTTKYLIQVKHNSTNKYHCTEVLLIHDGSDVYLTEYAVLHTGGSLIESIDARINNGLVEVFITPTIGNIQSKVSRISLTV